MLISKVRAEIEKVLTFYSWKVDTFGVWNSLNIKHGHCFSNIVIVVANQQQKPVAEIAQQLIKRIKSTNSEIKDVFLDKTFLNFIFHASVFNGVINQILLDENHCGYKKPPITQKIHYEWVSANPTGNLHLGHARNIFVGQAIVNLLQFNGHQVFREFYINDAGNQVFQLGKTVFYHYQKLLGNNLPPFAQMYQSEELVNVAQQIVDRFGDKYLRFDFDQNHKIQNFFIDFSKDFFLQAMQRNLAIWGIEFDNWFSERSLLTEKKVQQFFHHLDKNNLSYQKDGALWLRVNSTDSSQDFVLKKQNGETTYFVGDIMYHMTKFDRGFHTIIDVFGADHHNHYLKLRAVLKELNYDVDYFFVDLLQMVKIVRNQQEVKMSKRKGTTLYLHDIKDLHQLNFIKFMIMSRQKGTAFAVDLNLAQKQDRSNPFFYVQYAYARVTQLLYKFYKTNIKHQSVQYQQLSTSHEQNLLLQLHAFNSVIEKATTYREPHLLVNYLLEISRKFHRFYENAPLINAPLSLQKERLSLVRSFLAVFTKVGQILGIQLYAKL